MTTINLKYVGTKLYRGYDEARKAMVLAFPNTTHDLSPAKADQVLRDFPKDWIVAPAERGEPPAPILPASEVQDVQERAPEPAQARQAAPKKKGSGRR